MTDDELLGHIAEGNGAFQFSMRNHSHDMRRREEFEQFLVRLESLEHQGLIRLRGYMRNTTTQDPPRYVAVIADITPRGRRALGLPAE